MQCVCGEIAQGRAHGEGRHDRGPVEQLSAVGVDRMERQSVFGAVPNEENRREDQGVEAGRDRVGDAEDDMHHIGGHRAEDADHDHRAPIRPGVVAAEAQLHGQGSDEGEETQHDRDLWVDAGHQEVGGGFAHGGGQSLDDPEHCGDLGNPQRADAGQCGGRTQSGGGGAQGATFANGNGWTQRSTPAPAMKWCRNITGGQGVSCHAVGACCWAEMGPTAVLPTGAERALRAQSDHGS